MDNLQKIRNELLKLHKTLLDIERANYETQFGKISNMQLLNLLFENERFIWLREISSLVAEIDEMFASKKGIDFDNRFELLKRSETLFDESETSPDFKNKYQNFRKSVGSVNNHHERIVDLLQKEKA